MINPYQDLKQQEHQTFNYESFCQLVREPIETGKKKISQFKNWSNYMYLTKGYDKITLNKIYTVDEMLLITHNVKFTEYISDLIIIYLAHSKNKVETLTYKEFAEYFYMVNSDYYKAKYKKNDYFKKFSTKKNLSIFTKVDMDKRIYEDMGIFFNITDKIIKEIIKNALKSLKNKGLILYSDNFKLYKNVQIDDNTYITKTYICNKEQRKEFLDIRKSIMRLYGIEKIQDIIYLSREKRELYFKNLQITMSKSKILNHCTKYGNAFNIEFGEKSIQYEYKRIISENRKVINNNIQYKLLTTKEFKSINDALKKQFISEFIEK